MSNYLLIKQGTIHNAIEEEPFVADILVENGKIKKIAPVLEGKIINDADVIDATGIDVYISRACRERTGRILSRRRVRSILLSTADRKH